MCAVAFNAFADQSRLTQKGALSPALSIHSSLWNRLISECIHKNEAAQPLMHGWMVLYMFKLMHSLTMGSVMGVRVALISGVSYNHSLEMLGNRLVYSVVSSFMKWTSESPCFGCYCMYMCSGQPIYMFWFDVGELGCTTTFAFGFSLHVTLVKWRTTKMMHMHFHYKTL